MKTIIVNHVSIISLFLIITLTSCGTTDPEDNTNYSNKILFTSSRSGIEQLYMMNPDGSDIKQITSGEYWHNSGRWSPDAKKIVCNTEEGTTTAWVQMAIMNADGSDRKLLGYGSQMSWHPDGSIILFTYCPSCEIGIFNMKLYSIDPGGNERVIVSERFGGETAFSPEGDQVAFVSSDTTSSTQVIIMDYPTFNNTKLIGPKGALNPRWSPDGQKITFSMREYEDKQYDIFIMNSDGSDVQKITNNSSNNIFYLYPRWSPDGEKIIFLANTVDGTQKWYLYMVNNDGTDLHKIIDDDTVTSHDWSK
jgi:TolB protein